MDLAELANTLPNGFHDAQLHALHFDFTNARLVLNLDVWVGDIDNPARREAYRPAEVRIDGLVSVVIEPPASTDLRLKAGSIRIDSGVGEPPHCRTTLPEPPPGHFRGYLFLDDVNTFLHLVGKNAALEWQGDEWISGSAVP